MPKIPVRKHSDTRSRVDRLLDRFRNNRFAALVIVAALGVGALASFTDSVRKLADALPSWHEASVTGEWKTDAPATFYFFKGPEFIRLKLQDAAGGQVVGSIQFGGSAQAEARTAPIADGKRNGKAVSFVLATGNGLHESMSGELAGDTLRLVAHLEQRGDIALTAHRIAQSAQLVDGRTAIFYAHQEYPDHRAACTAMLAHLDPPQPYKLSEPPTEWGDVHPGGTSRRLGAVVAVVRRGHRRPVRERRAAAPGVPGRLAHRAHRRHEPAEGRQGLRVRRHAPGRRRQVRCAGLTARLVRAGAAASAGR